MSPKLRLIFMYTVPDRVRMAYMICRSNQNKGTAHVSSWAALQASF